MKKQLLIGGGILVACIVIAAILIARRPSPPQRPPESQAPLVQTVPAEIRTGSLLVEGAGTVRAQAEVSLAAEVAGKVTFVNPALESGSYVGKGDVLIRIQPDDYRNAVEQARADVAQQDVSVMQAQEEADLARSEYEQFQRREQRRVSDEQRMAGASPDTQGDSTTSEPGLLVFREPQLLAAEASRQRARAMLAGAELAMSRTVVRAPFSGYVRSKSVAVGSYVAPGQAFAQLVGSDVLEVNVPLSRDEATLLPDLWADRGAAPFGASVYADYGGFRYRWEGYVDRAEAVLNPETRTINVVVRVKDPVTGGKLVADVSNAPPGGNVLVPHRPPPLFVGEFVQVHIQGVSLDRYLVVPPGAIRPDDTIWVVRDSALQILPIQVLQQVDASAMVLADSIENGEPVVVSALRVATQGMRVRPANGSDGRSRPSTDTSATR